MTQAASGIDLFIPEVYDIVWSLIILVIVAVFFYKFFMPKFNAIFDERAAKIQGNIAKAEQAKKDADEAKAKYEAQLSTARVDAAKIRDDARAEASHIIADARSRAESDAAQITASAQRSKATTSAAPSPSGSRARRSSLNSTPAIATRRASSASFNSSARPSRSQGP